MKQLKHMKFATLLQEITLSSMSPPHSKEAHLFQENTTATLSTWEYGMSMYVNLYGGI